MPGELAHWTTTDDLVLSYHYEFLPKGLISRLIVRMHRFVKQPALAWIGGALFERDNTQLLIQTTARGDVVLRSQGPDRKALLSVIASDLDALNARFGALDEKVEKRVPCICSLCRVSLQPADFSERKLLKRRQDNKHKIECDQSYEHVSVLALLDGIKFEDLPSWASDSPVEPPPDDAIGFSITEKSVLEKSAARTIKIFLASSEELEDDRNAFDLYFRQQNDSLRKEGLYLEIIRWENFIDAISETRLQEEYNEAVRNCDIFVSLFSTKAGKYTEEEFDVAYKAYQATKIRPRVYTFFKNTQINMADADIEALMSLRKFQEKLKELGHFHTQYNEIEHLKRQFSDQLRKLREK